jgi:uncharacterized membrane protein YvlD (DUF360 family)
MFGALLRFAVTVAAIPLCAQYMAGVHATDWTQAAAIGAIIGVLYMILRPLMRLLLTVINWFTLGLLYVAVDAWLVWTGAGIMGGGVTFDNFWWALAVALVVNAARTIVGALTGKLRE